MRTQACSCICMILPRNLNPSFLFILFLISVHKCVSVLTPLCMYESMFHCLIVCLPSHVKIRVYVLFICFKYHEHVFTCSYIDTISAVMWRGNIILLRFDEHDMMDWINMFVILMLWMLNMICLSPMFLP